MQLSQIYGRCPECDSPDLAHFAHWFTGEIPAGIEGFVGCRDCQSWWHLVSIAPAVNIFEPEKWRVIQAGQGPYDGQEEMEKVTTYKDADYFRHGDAA